MTSVKITLKDIIRYTFSNYKTVLLIATLMLVISALGYISENRSDIISPIAAILLDILIFIEVGYGAEIIRTSYLGHDTPPKLTNIWDLIKEGFKRTLIYLAYGLISILLFRIETYFPFYSIEAAVCDFLIIVVNVLLSLGMINKFIHNNEFKKAFNLKEMLMLFKQYKLKKLIYVIISILISQSFVISCIVDIHPGLTIIDVILAILTFFLAPLTLISTKRLIGLTFKEIIPKNWKEKT